MKAIDPAVLKGQDRVSYELLLEKCETAIEGQRFTDADALVLSTLGGIQNFMPRAAQVTPFRTAADYRDYIARLSAMGSYADAVIERMKLGLASGWLSPRPVLDRVVAAIDSHIVSDASKSVLLGPFSKMPASIDLAAQAQLRDAAQRAIATDYQPALLRVKAFIQKEYRPKAPAEAGLAAR